jgi:hypothetical protein
MATDSALVLITGPGRSGTSTMAGALHHLGLAVPGPHLASNDTNPRGFYENAWSVRFHNRLLKRAGVGTFDGRPEAVDLVAAAVRPRDREALVRFLREHHESQVVVKDPRSTYAQELWRDAANEAGLAIRYVGMLRHPTEVVGSRKTAYLGAVGPDARRRFQVATVARWVNATLVSERTTRGEQRAFVVYPELLADWRPVLGGVATTLGLRYEGDLTPGTHHAVDDFIEPSLRRHEPDWSGVEVPTALQEIAEGTWQATLALATGGGHDAEAVARLDELAARYRALVNDALALSADVVEHARLAGLREGRAEERAARRTVEETGGRELLKVVARRGAAKLRPGRAGRPADRRDARR